MTQLLRTMGDRLLQVVLHQADAGACVPEHGQQCGCFNHVVYRYDCLANCTVKTTTPC